MKTMNLCYALFIACALNLNLAHAEKFFTPDQDKEGIDATSEIVEGLPDVLIIGDSISIGYTKPTIELLKGIANVQRAPANCGDTNRGLKSLKKWLGSTSWDVIHFNFGLHDLCYRHPNSKVQGNRDKIRGSQGVPLAQYEKNLEKLVLRLKATGATLIWASTTQVPKGEAGRKVGDDLKYNEVAAKVMTKHGIEISDLHAAVMSFNGAYFVKPGDVHFTKEGSEKLAEKVAQAITASLNSSKQLNIKDL